jgi:hypothetical protein
MMVLQHLLPDAKSRREWKLVLTKRSLALARVRVDLGFR